MVELTRAKALQLLDELFEAAFGSDKGSGEAWDDWCADQGLCEYWDGEEELTDAHQAPGQFDILIAAGFTPAEIVEHLHVNPDVVRGLVAVRVTGCEHEWTDMRNEVITSGEWCRKCSVIRP